MLSMTGPETTWSRLSGMAPFAPREGETASKGKDGDVKLAERLLCLSDERTWETKGTNEDGSGGA